MDLMTAMSDVIRSIETGELRYFKSEHRALYFIALDQVAENMEGETAWRTQLDEKYKISVKSELEASDEYAKKMSDDDELRFVDEEMSAAA